MAVALDAFMDETSGFDLLSALKADPEIADIPEVMMPERDGFEYAKRLRPEE